MTALPMGVLPGAVQPSCMAKACTPCHRRSQAGTVQALGAAVEPDLPHGGGVALVDLGSLPCGVQP